jgi:Na+/H+ antiporter NhaA
LLAIFFFVVGVELKREFVAGVCVTRRAPPFPSPRRSAGWSCRRSLAVVSTHLPTALRTFLLPLAAATWALVQASGIHATVAGVVLGFTVPVLGRNALAERFERRLRQPVTVGIIAGLVVGKPLGVFITTFLLAKFSRAELDDDLAWRDAFGVALLAGVGFTVS